MKITNIKASIVAIPFKKPGLYLLGAKEPEQSYKFVFVEMFTDEGVKGIGVQKDLSGVTVNIIEKTIKDFLIERHISPFNTEMISELLRRVEMHSGQCSAVEIAAWDIIGKVTGMPISKLLGGYRDQIKVYISTGELKTSSERIEEIEGYIEQGIKAIKLKAHHSNYKEDIKHVQDIKDYFGDKIEIMVDGYRAQKTESSFPPPWTRNEALEIARSLEECGVLWLEEPLPIYDKEGLAELCAKVDIYIAGGEAEYGIYTFKEFLERKIYDIIQCDVTLSGGFMETKKIASMAQAFGKWCIPHAWSVGPGIIANLHLCCAIPNCPYFEYVKESPAFNIDVRDAIISEPLLIKNGYVKLPSGPGLGVEINYDVINKYKI